MGSLSTSSKYVRRGQIKRAIDKLSRWDDLDVYVSCRGALEHSLHVVRCFLIEGSRERRNVIWSAERDMAPVGLRRCHAGGDHTADGSAPLRGGSVEYLILREAKNGSELFFLP